jgi:predicted DsbA family dithiol-disulfide isomerase
MWAAAASECAAEQDSFWAYHDAIFDNWNGENRGAFSEENLKSFAAELGLDSVAFDECFDSGRGESLAQQETSQSQQMGVSSTPTFMLNDIAIRGALPYESFRQAIEDELAAVAAE